MSLFKLECQVPINKLIWSGFNMDILAYLMNGDLVFFRYQKVKDGENFKMLTLLIELNS